MLSGRAQSRTGYSVPPQWSDGPGSPRAEPCGQAGQHRDLHRGHDFAGLRAEHREAEDAVVRPDDGLHEAGGPSGRPRAQDGSHRQLYDADGGVAGQRLGLA